MRLARMSFTALLVLGAALPLQGYIGLILGTPTGGNEFGECEGAQLLEPTVGNMYMGREGGAATNDILAILDGGTTLIGCNGWSAGFFDCPGGNFAPEPTTADEAVWAIVPMYPAGEAAGDHRGWVFVDVTSGTTADFGFNVTQALWPHSVNPGVATGGDITTDPTSGYDYRLRAVVEFGRDMTGSGPTCRVGGDANGTDFDDRPFLGYNVYRLAGVDAATSTPDHYLYGPDLTPGNADDGWVGFIPSGDGTSGLNLSDATGSAATNDNDITDPYGIEGTGATVEDDVHLIYSDNPLFGNIGAGDLLTQVTYVFQPVMKGDPTDDADGDGIPDLDLDGDTTPEFISPGGNGLGLTADIGGNRAILISMDLMADGTTPTPAGDAVQFEGSYNARTGAFDLHFISSLEADLAGFNLYRSEDQRSFRQVNGTLIPAKGTALAKYVYTDPMRVRTRTNDLTVYYKVEAVNLDGSTDLYGPYTVTYTSTVDSHRSRSIR